MSRPGTRSPALTLSYGADWTKETADTITDKTIEVIGLFGEAQYAATDTLDLSLSLRHDDNSQFGGFTTARTALTWRATPDLTVRSSLGNGFRAPSLGELYGAFGANPDLDPETSRSFDLGVEKTFAIGRGNVGHCSSTPKWTISSGIRSTRMYRFRAPLYRRASSSPAKCRSGCA